jgi:HEPN domain-containing protein
MARDYILRAKSCSREAEQALNESDAAGVVRRSQEALELAVKAVLRYLGVEYPKEHDVSDALETVKEELSDALKQKLPELKDLSKKLAELRGPAMYGFEREGIPPSRVFTMDFASSTFSKMKEMVDLCREFVEGALREC